MNNRHLSLVEHSAAESVAAEKRARAAANRESGDIATEEFDIEERLCRLSQPLARALETQTEEQLERIVLTALSCSGGGEAKSARQSLAAAIDCNPNIKIRGFSRASKAKPEQLVSQVLEECYESDSRLLGAVLRAWRSANAPLRTRVESHLAEIEVEPEGVDFKEASFPLLWEWRDWSSQVGAMLEAEGEARDFESAEAGGTRLMLSLVSGAVPARPGEVVAAEIESPPLRDWLQMLWNAEILEKLGPDLGDFIKALTEIEADFAASRILNFIEDTERLIESLSGGFREELAYLEIDLDTILSQFEENRELLLLAPGHYPVEMAELLDSYRRIKPQGGSAREERERAPKRRELEESIAELHEKWQVDIDRQRASLEQEEPQRAAGSGEDDATALSLADESVGKDLKSMRDELRNERRKLEEFRKKYENLKSGYDDLKEESRKLKRRCATLERQKEEWDETRGRFEEKLALADTRAESERAEGARESRAEYFVQYAPEQLENVTDAVNQARRTFGAQLLFALNSKSQENSGFQRPAEVFAALAWLATDYRACRLDPDAGPVEFNEKLKAVLPNWFYIPRQSPTARGKYPDWYTTTVNGTSHELQLHIGKGKSHDAKSNIRIAFAWDGKDARIVVGYIGRHQRTDRS